MDTLSVILFGSQLESIYLLILSSRSNKFLSYNCIIAIPVNILLLDPRLNLVLMLFFTRYLLEASPLANSNRIESFLAIKIVPENSLFSPKVLMKLDAVEINFLSNLLFAFCAQQFVIMIKNNKYKFRFL